MSQRQRQTLDARLLMKGSVAYSGSTPTTPTAGTDHLSGTWLTTDIYIREVYVNAVDERMWIRMNDNIRELGLLPVGAQSGDMFYFSGNSLNKIALGTEGQQLTINTGKPSWETSTVSPATLILLQSEINTLSANTSNYALTTTIPAQLFDTYVTTGNTTTNESDLFSYTTGAGLLANNGSKLEIYLGGNFVSSGTATRQIRIYFAGTAIFDTGALTLSLSAAWTVYVEIMRVSSSVVRYMITFATEGAALSAYTTVGELTGLTLSGTNVIKITGQAAGIGAATNDILLKIGSGKWVPPAA